MKTRILKVINKMGIHARPAGAIVDLTSRAQSDVFLIYSGTRANAKSILNVMMLAITPGSEVQFEANGADEDDILNKLEKLFNDRFNEEHYDP